MWCVVVLPCSHPNCFRVSGGVWKSYAHSRVRTFSVTPRSLPRWHIVGSCARKPLLRYAIVVFCGEDQSTTTTLNISGARVGVHLLQENPSKLDPEVLNPYLFGATKMRQSFAYKIQPFDSGLLSYFTACDCSKGFDECRRDLHQF